MMKDAHRVRKAAEGRVDNEGADMVASAAKLLGDMQALGTHIGLDPNQATVPE